MHNMAQTAALAGIAAQKQGKFWQMHDALFSAGQLNQKAIEDAAKSIGLNVEQFKKDMADPATKQRLYKDMMDAQKADVTGTPTLFINGHRVRDRSLPAMQKMIDQQVKAADKK